MDHRSGKLLHKGHGHSARWPNLVHFELPMSMGTQHLLAMTLDILNIDKRVVCKHCRAGVRQDNCDGAAGAVPHWLPAAQQPACLECSI